MSAKPAVKPTPKPPSPGPVKPRVKKAKPKGSLADRLGALEAYAKLNGWQVGE